jgi:hypothetical protein
MGPPPIFVVLTKGFCAITAVDTAANNKTANVLIFSIILLLILFPFTFSATVLGLLRRDYCYNLYPFNAFSKKKFKLSMKSY